MEAQWAQELEQCVVDKVLLRRLLFHWRTAHAMLRRLDDSQPESAENSNESEMSTKSGPLMLSHIHATAFLRLIRTMQVSPDKPLSKPLPKSLLECFCPSCSSLLMPGKSSTVRIVHQSHKAPINKKLARQHAASKRKAKILHKPVAPFVHVRNAVITTCLRCQYRHTAPGAPVRKRQIKPTAPAPPPAAPVQQPLKRPGGLFGPSASPPRKLLDGPVKKKKKKKAGEAPPSALDSFLKSLQ
ncbi:hypothetical protein LEN26_019037 [Aphanomyces euteiches]|nr:hypothetical protein LEN26_019037 [Aphanomyces euteiches]KAH9116350.1 hypothetical protein AeMF1_009712 [Aphanomyces euteiches]KAH9192687.1 hypothetical protein AeNC1_005340 [Aphanomyces euteiches]